MIDSMPVDLSHQELSLFSELHEVYLKKSRRNLLRTVYFEGKNAFKDFGIAIPPKLRDDAFTPLGWIEKGVRAMTDRSVLEGFVSPDGSDDPMEISRLITDNSFDTEFPQAQVSSAVHACSFLTVSRGDVQSGEPEVMIIARQAEYSAGLWDRRRRRMRGFLSVTSTDDTGMPDEFVMYTPDYVITLARRKGSWATISRWANQLKMVSVAPLTLKPELGRPFGHSRITRPAMALVDSAIRTLMRSEVSSELYSAPDYWLFGADPDAFAGDNKWKAVIGRIKAIARDEDGEIPQINRFSGSSPQPFTDQMRMLATLFAGDQGLSVSSLGVTQDNPSSAEAIYAAKEDLIIETRAFNRSTGSGAVKALQMAAMLRDGLDEVPDELRRLSAQFTDPAMTSPTAQSDAFTKRASAIPGFAETEVGLESAGLTREQVLRFRNERRRSTASSRLDALITGIGGQEDRDGVDGVVEVAEGK